METESWRSLRQCTIERRWQVSPNAIVNSVQLLSKCVL